MIVDVHSAMKNSFKKLLGRNVCSSFLGAGRLRWLSLSVLLCGFPVLAQSRLLPVLHGVESGPVGHQEHQHPPVRNCPMSNCQEASAEQLSIKLEPPSLEPGSD